MASKGRSNLNVNERGVDINWYRDAEHMFDYLDWKRTTNYIPERFDIPTYTVTPAYGSPCYIEFDKRGDLLGKVELVVTRSAVSWASAAPTTYFFSDFEGFSSIDYVRWWYANKIVHEDHGERMMIRTLKEADSDERDVIAQQQYGFLSDTDRQTQAQSKTTWVVDLIVPWDDIKKQLPILTFPNKVKLEIGFKALKGAFYYSGDTPTVTINTVNARSYYIHLPQYIKQDLWNHIYSRDGVSVKTITSEYHLREAVAASSSTTTYKVAIKNIKNAVVNMTAVIRKQTEVDNTAGNTLDLWNFRSPSRVYLEDSGSEITVRYECADSTDGSTPADYNYWKDNWMMHPKGIQGYFLPEIPFCQHHFVESSRHDCYGSRNFSKYNNPYFTMVFDGGNGNIAEYCDLWADIHNLMIWHKGDWRKYLV